MVQASDFVKDGRIQIGALGTVLVGSTFLAAFQGIASVFLSLVDLLLTIPAWGARFAANLIGALLGLFPAVISGSFQAAIPFVGQSGPLGFVVAVAIVLASAYVLSVVVARVR